MDSTPGFVEIQDLNVKHLADDLERRKAMGRYRGLSLPGGMDLSSNDYLGLSQHPALRQAAMAALQSGIEIGAAGSRLLRGHRAAHEELEAFAADYYGSQRALFFANGFQANYAVITTLIGRHDVVLFDSLSHASLRDGLHASHCRAVKIAHNDLDAFERMLKKPRDAGTQAWIIVESVYSMDGDLAPLTELLALAEAHDAMLIVDEAHGTGIFGQTGKGLSESLPHERLISIHTCGKALGVAGALVCAGGDIIDYLINTARPFIYSTAPMPLQAVLVKRALELVRDEPERRQHLFDLMTTARRCLPRHAVHSPIIPIVIGEDAAAVAMAGALQARGFDIRAVRPPTVPEGTARLRLSLNAGLSHGDVESFCTALHQLMPSPESTSESLPA